MAKRKKESPSDRARKYRSRERFKGTLSEFRVFEELLRDGWEVWPKGWPDFLAVRGDEIRFIEVKSGNDRLSPDQKDIFALINKHLGMHVEVIHLGPKK
jgi:hypothetical protein